MSEVLYFLFSYVLPIIVLLIMVAGGILATGVALEAEGHWQRYSVPLVLAIVLLSVGVGSALSGRNVSIADVNMFSNTFAGASSINTWVLRFCTTSVLIICAACILASVFRADHKGRVGHPLYYAFVLYFLGNNVLNAALGTHPAFVHGSFYPFALFTLIYICHRDSPDAAIDVARHGLMLFFLASFAVAVVMPDVAIQRGYQGIIPGLHIRFWGLGSNPNSIGPLAAIAILLLMLKPYRRGWLQRCALLLAGLVLLLSQSKTAWGALFLSIMVTFTYRRLAGDDQRSDTQGFLLGLFSLAAFGLAALTIVVWSWDIGAWVDRLMSTREGMEAATLTGRVKIWEAVFDIWRANTLFGYGPTIWDPAHRLSLGMTYAFSAHNQWLQSLGAAGLVGLLSLLVYQWQFWLATWRARTATKGISLALFTFTFIRCISEVPLEIRTLLNGDLFTHALLFLLLLHYGRKRPEAIPAAAVMGMPPPVLQKG